MLSPASRSSPTSLRPSSVPSAASMRTSSSASTSSRPPLAWPHHSSPKAHQTKSSRTGSIAISHGKVAWVPGAAPLSQLSIIAQLYILIDAYDVEKRPPDTNCDALNLRM